MGRMFANGPGSHSVFTNTTALESAANRLNRCRLNQMHGARKRRSAVHLFTGGFHSKNCISPVGSLPVTRKGDDVLQVDHSSLYPALHRLERKGWLTSKWEDTETNR